MAIVPVAMAINNDFTLPCYIEISSLIRRINKKDEYIIYIMSDCLSRENRRLLQSLADDQVSIDFIDMKEWVGNDFLPQIGPLTKEVYYRFYISKILVGYEKIIYLDSDLLILCDIAELLRVDLNGEIFGAVENPSKGVAEINQKFDLPINWPYFNDGILLIDRNKFEDNQIREKCLQLLIDNKNKLDKFSCGDQDLLNIICERQMGSYHLLSNAWNHTALIIAEDSVKDHCFLDYYSAEKDAKIIHFNGRLKPWLGLMTEKADLWWDEARQTEVYDQCVREIRTNVWKLSREKQAIADGVSLFPFNRIHKGDLIALYGGGYFGNGVYDFLYTSKYAKVVCWVDQNHEEMHDDRITNTGKLTELYNDYQIVLIAIYDIKIQQEIIEDLVRSGIEESRIARIGR